MRIFVGLPSASVHSDFWLVMEVDQRNPLESRLICFGIRHWFLELSKAAIGWLISSLIPDWSAKDSGSDLLWDSPQVWDLVESVILLGSSASCFGSLYATQVFIGEKLFRSSASKSICLVCSQIGLQLCLFALLNRIKWLSQIWFPATWFRLGNAFT